MCRVWYLVFGVLQIVPTGMECGGDLVLVWVWISNGDFILGMLRCFFLYCSTLGTLEVSPQVLVPHERFSFQFQILNICRCFRLLFSLFSYTSKLVECLYHSMFNVYTLLKSLVAYCFMIRFCLVSHYALTLGQFNSEFVIRVNKQCWYRMWNYV